MLDIFKDGSDLISATLAAKKTGYSSDYIGQLARAKKIPAQLVGRSWYVDLPALLEYKKTKRVLPEQRKLYSSTPAQFVYSSDASALLPPLLRKSPIQKPPKLSVKLVSEISVITLSLVALMSVGLFALEQNNPYLANSLERNVVSLAQGEKGFISNVRETAKAIDSLFTGFSDLRSMAMKTFFIAGVPAQHTSPSPLLVKEREAATSTPAPAQGSGGTKTCLNKAQLDSVLVNTGSSYTVIGGASVSSGSSSVDTTATSTSFDTATSTSDAVIIDATSTDATSTNATSTTP